MGHSARLGRGGLRDDQYVQLLDFRVALRAFERWSEQLSAEAGLTHAQHQLLVAIRGHRGVKGPTISDVARYLMVRHHSAIGLINRAEAAGLVKRQADTEDRRLVRLGLTTAGRDRVEALSALHLEELRRLAPLLAALLGDNHLTSSENVDKNGARRRRRAPQPSQGVS